MISKNLFPHPLRVRWSKRCGSCLSATQGDGDGHKEAYKKMHPQTRQFQKCCAVLCLDYIVMIINLVLRHKLKENLPITMICSKCYHSLFYFITTLTQLKKKKSEMCRAKYMSHKIQRPNYFEHKHEEMTCLLEIIIT